MKKKYIKYLDVWQAHEVLGEVDHELVHEALGYVETIHHVVEAVSLLALADVVVGAEHGDVGAVPHGRLEEGVDHALAPGDILLVVRDVVGQALPPVLVRLLRLVHLLGRHHLEPVNVGGGAAGALAMVVVHGRRRRHLLLAELLPEEAAPARGGGLYIYIYR